jgi:hypothetical protein
VKKIIGIIGSRSRDSENDFTIVRKKFIEIYQDGDWICSGGCPHGGDRFARLLHIEFSTPYLEFPANWKKYGKSAGYRRNADIAKASDVLIACVNEARTGGVEDTIERFYSHNNKEMVYIV